MAARSALGPLEAPVDFSVALPPVGAGGARETSLGRSSSAPGRASRPPSGSRPASGSALANKGGLGSRNRARTPSDLTAVSSPMSRSSAAAPLFACPASYASTASAVERGGGCSGPGDFGGAIEQPSPWFMAGGLKGHSPSGHLCAHSLFYVDTGADPVQPGDSVQVHFDLRPAIQSLQEVDAYLLALDMGKLRAQGAGAAGVNPLEASSMPTIARACATSRRKLTSLKGITSLAMHLPKTTSNRDSVIVVRLLIMPHLGQQAGKIHGDAVLVRVDADPQVRCPRCAALVPRRKLFTHFYAHLQQLISEEPGGFAQAFAELTGIGFPVEEGDTPALQASGTSSSSKAASTPSPLAQAIEFPRESDEEPTVEVAPSPAVTVAAAPSASIDVEDAARDAAAEVLAQAYETLRSEWNAQGNLLGRSEEKADKYKEQLRREIEEREAMQLQLFQELRSAKEELRQGTRKWETERQNLRAERKKHAQHAAKVKADWKSELRALEIGMEKVEESQRKVSNARLLDEEELERERGEFEAEQDSYKEKVFEEFAQGQGEIAEELKSLHAESKQIAQARKEFLRNEAQEEQAQSQWKESFEEESAAQERSQQKLKEAWAQQRAAAVKVAEDVRQHGLAEKALKTRGAEEREEIIQELGESEGHAMEEMQELARQRQEHSQAQALAKQRVELSMKNLARAEDIQVAVRQEKADIQAMESEIKEERINLRLQQTQLGQDRENARRAQDHAQRRIDEECVMVASEMRELSIARDQAAADLRKRQADTAVFRERQAEVLLEEALASKSRDDFEAETRRFRSHAKGEKVAFDAKVREQESYIANTEAGLEAEASRLQAEVRDQRAAFEAEEQNVLQTIADAEAASERYRAEAWDEWAARLAEVARKEEHVAQSVKDLNAETRRMRDDRTMLDEELRRAGAKAENAAAALAEAATEGRCQAEESRRLTAEKAEHVQRAVDLREAEVEATAQESRAAEECTVARAASKKAEEDKHFTELMVQFRRDFLIEKELHEKNVTQSRADLENIQKEHAEERERTREEIQRRRLQLETHEMRQETYLEQAAQERERLERGSEAHSQRAAAVSALEAELAQVRSARMQLERAGRAETVEETEASSPPVRELRAHSVPTPPPPPRGGGASMTPPSSPPPPATLAGSIESTAPAALAPPAIEEACE